MTMDEKIKRINELYHKSQAEGLNEEELAEQKRLRQDYIASVRGNLPADGLIASRSFCLLFPHPCYILQEFPRLYR